MRYDDGHPVLRRFATVDFAIDQPRSPAAHVESPRPFGRPRWRGRMHTWAFFTVIPAGLFLALSTDRASTRIAGSIYAITLALVFGTSAAYHRLTRSDRARLLMQKLDHSMIYTLIAGTYTPLCLVALPPIWGLSMLVAVVGAAVIGIAVTMAAFDRARRFAYSLYPAMGGGALVAGPTLADHLSGAQFALIIGGVLAYGAGVPVLFTRRPDPWPTSFGYHEIWHVLTILAAAMHFVAIRDLLV